MKEGFAPMTEIPLFIEAFEWFRADSYFGVMKLVLVGCVLTFLVQSSSATLAITIGLAATGAIPFTAAAALVLGENIGTTITVILASIGANVNGKRTAYAHVLFNMIGVFWITLIFQWYVRLVAQVVQGVHGANPMTMVPADFASPLEFGAVVTAGIALTHTGFNVTNALLFLPFLRPYARFLERLVPEPEVKEVRHLKHLDARAVSAPVLGVEQSHAEVVQMGSSVVKMMAWIRQVALQGQKDERVIEKTFHREEVLDNIQAEVTAFLTEILDTSMPHAIAEEGRRQLRIAHEYESMSDRLASILRAYLKLQEMSLELPSDQVDALTELHDQVAEYLGTVTRAYATRTAMPEASAQSTSASISRKVEQLREHHLHRMTNTSVDPNLSLIYVGLLTDYRRVRAHTVNVHEAMTAGGTIAGSD
jgi:phosphate:Na+ symporter